MKALIFVMGLMATIAYAQIDMSTLGPAPPRQPIPEHKASGFGGYGFGSSRNFVRTGRAHDRHIFDKEFADWIWYMGTIEGCGFDSGYQFSRRDKLMGGIWVIRNDDECFKKVQTRLVNYYGDDHRTIEMRGSTIVAEMWVPHTRIVHRKSPTAHTVSFYDTFERTKHGGP